MKNVETLHNESAEKQRAETTGHDIHPNYVEIVQRGVSNRQNFNLNPEQCLPFKFRNCQYEMSLVMRYSEKTTRLSM